MSLLRLSRNFYDSVLCPDKLKYRGEYEGEVVEPAKTEVAYHVIMVRPSLLISVVGKKFLLRGQLFLLVLRLKQRWLICAVAFVPPRLSTAFPSVNKVALC